MTKPELDEAKRLAEDYLGGFSATKSKYLFFKETYIFAKTLLHQSQELERLREIISGFLYNFECDKECQCCNYNNGQIDELRNYALEKQIQCNTD